MGTSKRGPHKPRKLVVTEWTSEMDGGIHRHAASGMNASVISEATGIPSRSIIRRLAVSRKGAKADTRRRAEDHYGLRTPAARKAEAAIGSWMLETARDNTNRVARLGGGPPQEAAREGGSSE